jgi:hypothetical protein
MKGIWKILISHKYSKRRDILDINLKKERIQ